MKKTWLLYPLFFLLLIVFFIISCVKTDPNSILNNLPGGPGGNDITPAYTDVGSPVGSPVTKTIGAEGGTIASDDGRMQLTIPAGALSVSTDITIQPVTNQCPGGIGLAYDMLPNGTKFAKPATLVFHYTDEELDSTEPYFLFVAYQDSLNEWLADIVYRDVDITAKTVTLDINHFTPRSDGSRARCLTNPDAVHSDETSIARAVDLIEASPSKGSGTGDNELASLGNTNPLPSVSDWKVNGIAGGNSANGFISGNGATATYTPPASIAKKRDVSVSARFISTKLVSIYNKGKLVRTTANSEPMRVVGKITLLPKFSYRVLITYQESGTNPCYIDSYTDTATFQVDVADDVVTVSDIVNDAPHTVPESGPSTQNNTEACYWMKDGIGLVQIDEANGIVFPTGNVGASVTKHVQINLTGDGYKPQWLIRANGAKDYYYGGDKFPTLPPQINFLLNDQTQETNFTTPNSQGYSATTTTKIVPRF